jgi:CheY-like chemotaxis protein
MAKVRLIHWDPEGAKRGARTLERSGHVVDSAPLDPAALKALRANPPDVILIDLSRSPSQGRDLGVLLRKTGSTRRVPLVFVGGEPGKVRRVAELLPDAVYTEWSRARGAVTRALRQRSSDPVVPESTFAACAGTPLAGKLGIKPGSVVALVGAPEGFEDRIGGLPRDVTIRRGARGRCDLAVWFARSRSEVERRVGKLAEFAGADGLWIAWPKRASGMKSDLTQTVVRRIGLDSGLVDFKVCSIDDTWSGLRFTRRTRRRRT